MYGLNDAPLAWQLCLHEFLKKHGGVPSLMDENLFIWKSPPPENHLKALLSTHVDDLASAALRTFLDWLYELLVKEFGNVTRQTMPFDHCGCRYEKVDDGFRMSQRHFAEKLVCVEIPEHRRDSDSLDAKELTSFRSILGGLLWLTATRLDLIADVSLLQSKVTKACVEHLRQANKVVEKAKHPDFLDLSLHYRRLRGPLRLVCVHDASSASKDRNYAQEGILVLLCEDGLHDLGTQYKLEADDDLAKKLSGRSHVLWSHGAKAKRVSYSTSHAETLSAIGGLETVSLVAVRLSELYFKGKPSLKDLTQIQEFGNDVLPVDCMTDCRDFFELTTGERTLPQDKGQRLYVLAHKEARINGRIRWMVLVPTQSMVADALTKPMLAPQLLHLMTTGVVHYYNEENHPMLLRRLPPLHEYDEDTILKTDDELVNMFLAVVTASATRVSKPFLVAAIMASQSTLVGASTSSSTTSTSSTTSSWLDYDFVIFWLLTAFIVLIIERAVIHGGLYLQSLLQSLSTAWTSSSSSTATSGTTSMSSTGFRQNRCLCTTSCRNGSTRTFCKNWRLPTVSWRCTAAASLLLLSKTSDAA